MVNTLCDYSARVMRTAPLFPVAVGLVTGITLDNALQPSLLAYLSVFAAGSMLSLTRPVRAMTAPLLAFVVALCVGGVLHLAAQRTAPVSGIERYTGSERRIARIQGTVASQPRVLAAREHPFARWTFRGDRSAFLVDVDSIEGSRGSLPATGKVRVTVGEALLDLRENDRVQVFGWLYQPRPPANPGQFDWAGRIRRQGIGAAMSCKVQEQVQRLDETASAPVKDFITNLRTTMRGLLTDDLAAGTEEEASLLEAMILGHRSRLDRRLNDVFVRAGCIHFLAVSGVHVAIVMSLVSAVGVVFLATPRQRIWAMLLVVIIYALVAEPRPPILRATVIAVLYCTSRLLGRERSSLNWVSAAAIVLAVVNPGTVFDVGYQLSFSAVLGVIYLRPAVAGVGTAFLGWTRRTLLRQTPLDEELARLKVVVPDPHVLTRAAKALRRYVWKSARVALVISLAAWLASVPIVAVHFYRFHLWAPANSVIVLPLVTAVMALGLAKLIVGAVSPAAGAIVAVGVTGVDGLLIQIVERLGYLPGASLPVSMMPWWLMVSYYAFLAALIWRFSRRSNVLEEAQGEQQDEAVRRSRLPGGACLLTLTLLVVCTVAWCVPRAPDERLVVTTLSVGAGCAIVVELPDGRTILIDAGNSSSFDVGRNTIVPFLRHRGISRIDRIYLSHPNLDHFSGVPAILDDVPTGPVMVNQYFERRCPPRTPGRHLLNLLNERGHGLQTLDDSARRWELGGVLFERLWPPQDQDETLSSNDVSTVLKLTYAGRSILLSGDIEERPQRALLAKGGLEADVLVLPHHGSVRSSTADFVGAVGAVALIRSSGQRMRETYNGLQELAGSTPIYNTADVGAVQTIIDHSGVGVFPLGQPGL